MKLVSMILIMFITIPLFGDVFSSVTHGPSRAAIYKVSIRLTKSVSVSTGFMLVHPITKKTVLVTNAHACDGFSSRTVLLEKYGAKHLGTIVKVSNKLDLCLIVPVFVMGPFKDFETVKLSKNNPKVGDEVYFTGYALGHKFMSFYTTFLGYEPPIPGTTSTYGSGSKVTGTLDILAFSGNSGSPLFNRSHEVVGVVYALTEGEGRTYFIPIKDLMYFLMNSEG